MMSDHVVEQFEGPDALAARAAAIIRETAAASITARGVFTLALSGGSTPEKAYRLLAGDAPGAVDWPRVRLFLGDERFVPADDARGNLSMIRRSLLTGPPSAASFFPVPTDAPTANQAARDYSRTLATSFGIPENGLPPRFDLILLGLGDDGHTASLFPHHEALKESQAWLVASPPGVLPPPVERVTFTFPVLNAARAVVFLVAGANKAGPLREILEGSASVTDRPAAGVRPVDGTLTWLIDRAASGK
jgi:6-phosphogluconolactonase